MKIEKGKLYYNHQLECVIKSSVDSEDKNGIHSDKIAVHCPTKEDWDYVCNKLNFNDLLIYRHSEYNDKSCINVNIGFCSKKWYKRNGYHIITIDQFKEFYPPQINIMKIEKGNKFLCIRDVIMFDGDIAYKKGEIYQSERDGCITDIQGDMVHRWTSDDAPHFYFKPLKEVDRAQEEDFDDPYNWVVNGMKDNSKYDKPKHYSKGIDTFSRMEANCTKEECLAFAKGNIDKYNWRTKGQDLEDFDKIISYAKWAKSILNKNDWNIQDNKS